MATSKNEDADRAVGQSTESKAASFLAAKSVLAGERMPRTAGDLKLLYFMLSKESGCDVMISEHEFRIQYGWLANESHYFLTLAAGVFSQILKWSDVTEPVGEFRRLNLGPVLSPHAIGGEWTAAVRTVWLTNTPDLISLRIRSGLHSTDESPPRIPSGHERAKELIDGGEQMCPHCKAVADEYRILHCGPLVCPSCGCSFTL